MIPFILPLPAELDPKNRIDRVRRKYPVRRIYEEVPEIR